MTRTSSRLGELAELGEILDAAASAALGDELSGGGAPWVLFGSAVLLLHGIRSTIADVDVFAAPAVWNRLLESPAPARWTLCKPDVVDPPYLERAIETGRDPVRVHVFYDWTAADPEVDALQCRRAAELVDGWPCTPLQMVRMHKAMAVDKHGADGWRQKHRRDVLQIDDYLQWAAA